MWGDRSKDFGWQSQWVDVYWLGWFVLFSVIIANQIPVDLFTVKSFLIGFGVSVIWDLIFVYVESQGQEWVAPLPKWVTIPNPFSKAENPLDRRWIIGFTKKQLTYFHYLRLAILLIGIIY
jgi:xanthine/uracil permease